MRHRWFTCVRLSDPYLTVLIPPFNHIVHDLAVTNSAACGSLKSAPVGRFRWTYHHLRYSIALSRFPGTLQEAPERKTLRTFLLNHIEPGSLLLTDGLSSYAGARYEVNLAWGPIQRAATPQLCKLSKCLAQALFLACLTVLIPAVLATERPRSLTGVGPINRSAEMPSPHLTRRTISKVRFRLRVKTSDTLARLPISGSKSLRFSPCCSIRN